MRTRTKTRSQPDEGPQSVEGNAASVADLVIGDDDMSGAGAAPSASYPAPDVSCPELDVARQRLAVVRESYRTEELVAEVLRAAQVAAAHRLVTEAEQDNAATLTGAVATFPPDITAAVAAQSALTALAAVRERLDPHPFVIAEVVEPTIEAAASHLAGLAGSATVVVPNYVRERTRYESLRTRAIPGRTPAPVQTETDASAERTYLRLIDDAAKLGNAVNEVLRVRSGTGDVLGWLQSVATYVEAVDAFAERIHEANASIVTANVWRQSRGYTWTPPEGVFVDTAVDPGATTGLFRITLGRPVAPPPEPVPTTRRPTEGIA